MSHIHLAAQEGDMLRVQELLSDEPDLVNAMDRCGHVPLIYAARSNEAQVTRLLLSKGADPNSSTGISGETPLLAASTRGFEGVVGLLLEGGAEPNLKDYNDGLTPLAAAAQGNHVGVLRVLLRHPKTCVEEGDDQNRSALWWAVKHRHTQATHVLLTEGQAGPWDNESRRELMQRSGEDLLRAVGARLGLGEDEAEERDEQDEGKGDSSGATSVKEEAKYSKWRHMMTARRQVMHRQGHLQHAPQPPKKAPCVSVCRPKAPKPVPCVGSPPPPPSSMPGLKPHARAPPIAPSVCPLSPSSSCRALKKLLSPRASPSPQRHHPCTSSTSTTTEALGDTLTSLHSTRPSRALSSSPTAGLDAMASGADYEALLGGQWAQATTPPTKHLHLMLQHYGNQEGHWEGHGEEEGAGSGAVEDEEELTQEDDDTDGLRTTPLYA